MATKDIFYPENHRLREDVVRLAATVYELLRSNFKATNELIECIHEFIPGRRFRLIQLDTGATVKANCKVLVRRLEQINEYIQEMLRRIEETIGTQKFRELTDTSLSFKRSVDKAQEICMMMEGAGLAFLSAAGISLVVKLQIGNLSTFSGVIIRLGASVLSTLTVSCLILAVDVIISLIIGAIEKSKLKSAIAELDKVIDDFEPESDKFNDTVYRVVCKIRARLGR